NRDPAETWDEFQAWLYRRVADDVVQTYASLHRRAQELAARVGEHFGEDGDEIAVDLDVANPTEALAAVDADTDVELSKMGLGSQRLTALRGSYGGMLMFGMLGNLAVLPMANPATLVIGPSMGRSAPRREKGLQLQLRRTQRRLRDYFAARAEELHRSATEALAAAQQAVKSDATSRQKRLRDVDAELKRIAVLREKAYALAPELKATAAEARS